MRPKDTSIPQDELFRSRLDQIINLDRPLVHLADRLEWDKFAEEFGTMYDDKQGRPGLPIRLMVGLTYLGRIYDLGDEEVVERWIDNPYWQYFCGEEYFQHEPPCDPSSLVRWRQRIGEKGVEFLLGQTVEVAKRAKMLSKHDLGKVNVDTTVQEKAIRYPTDVRLYHRMLEHLVKAAKERSIPLRQSYVRVSKKAVFKHSRYAHARQMKRAARETRKLKTLLGRVVRDIQRKVETPDEGLAHELSLASRLLVQERHDKHKLYSIHEPDVECISKGKVHKKYEFGCKVGVVSTSRSNWVVGTLAFHGNPYDGHTLTQMLDQVTRLTGWVPREAYCDLGYRGHDYRGTTRVHIVDLRKRSKNRSAQRWRKRRAAIEPIIGHLKTDHGLDRNRLKGTLGDNLNAMLAGCGKNLLKWLKILLSPFREVDFLWFLQKKCGILLIPHLQLET